MYCKLPHCVLYDRINVLISQFSTFDFNCIFNIEADTYHCKQIILVLKSEKRTSAIHNHLRTLTSIKQYSLTAMVSVGSQWNITQETNVFIIRDVIYSHDIRDSRFAFYAKTMANQLVQMELE